MEQTPITESGALIQSIRRAIQLLKAFDADQGELGVTELSRLVGLPKSTVSRMLATLEYEGLIERVPASDKYRLGFLLLRLAGRVGHYRDVRDVARPILLELSERARETVHLAVPDGDEVVNIEQISGPHLVRETNWVGRRTPFHCAANGKVLLAFQPAGTIERILAGPLTRFTDRTITDRKLVRTELAQVRERGFARAVGEIEAGLNGVAAPVRNAGGQVIAAVSAGGPAYRVTSARMHELGELVVGAAASISARLGYNDT
jgi:DNA-binding IclR family transcriptional regulator